MRGWEEFEKWLNSGNIPKQLEGLREIPMFENWFQQFRHASGIQSSEKQTENSQSYSIRENKDIIEISYPLPVHYDPVDIILFVREDFVKIEGLPEQHIELIKLPKLVKAKICKAKIQEDTLVIRLAKRPRPIKFNRHTISS